MLCDKAAAGTSQCEKCYWGFPVHVSNNVSGKVLQQISLFDLIFPSIIPLEVNPCGGGWELGL